MKYYLHDSNAFSDEKITMLYMKYGYEGLGLFYTALEKLANQEKPINTEVLKSQLKIGKRLEKVFQYCETLGILSSNNGETFSEQLLNYAEKYTIKKEKNREKIKQWRENQTDINIVTGYVPFCNRCKVKLSKVKIKECVSKKAVKPPHTQNKFKKPTVDEINQYASEKNIQIDAERFFNFYESKGWLVGKSPMKNWKAAVSNWASDKKQTTAFTLNEVNNKPGKL